jgi:hypothetical protein
MLSTLYILLMHVIEYLFYVNWFYVNFSLQ